MSYDVIPTIVMGVVAVFAIQGVTIYSVTKLLVTGRMLVERRNQQDDEDRPVLNLRRQ